MQANISSSISESQNNKELLAIKLITPLHIGSGEITFEVDKPVIKDIFGIPYIPASSLKGALKRIFHQPLDNSYENIVSIFGCEGKIFKHRNLPSFIDFLDAIPLAFLARELNNVFCYVTTSFYLLRVLQYYSLVKNSIDINKIKEIFTEDKAFVLTNESIYLNQKELVINEEEVNFEIAEIENEEIKNFITAIENTLNIKELSKRLIILPSTSESIEIIKRSLMVYTRNRLELEIKQAKQGGLWSEEYVPYESVFITVMIKNISNKKIENVISQGIRDDIDKAKKEEIKSILLKQLNEINKKDKLVIQVGGLESIGKGFILISKIREGENK